MKMLADAVQRCDDFETLAEWVAQGLKLCFATPSFGDVLYMPMGYLVLEVTPTEDEELDKETLTYGGRNNLFPLHASSVTAVARTIDLLNVDNVDLKRLDEVHELIKERVMQSQEGDGERG